MLAVGVMIWLGSELMFFSGLFAAFFTIRANTVGPWPPAGTVLDTARAGFFTAVLGRTPRIQAGAWVWTDVRRAPSPDPVSGATLASCLAASGAVSTLTAPWARCVLSAAAVH